jgi:hypothetical protein
MKALASFASEAAHFLASSLGVIFLAINSFSYIPVEKVPSMGMSKL